MEKVLNVVVFVFPNGDTLHYKLEEGKDNFGEERKIVDRWWELHPEYINTRTMGGCIEVKMLERDYLKLQSTSESYELTKGVGVQCSVSA